MPTPTVTPTAVPTATPAPTPTPASARDIAAAREALTAFYNAAGGEHWSNNVNWLSDAPLGEWYGVTTDPQGFVIELDLGDNQLSGEISPELGSLSNLTRLHLGGNELSGEIPTELGNLSNLRTLSLNVNDLSGKIPPELGSLSNLRALSLNHNRLSGEIPPELGSLSNLIELYLHKNRLIGKIPRGTGQPLQSGPIVAVGQPAERLCASISGGKPGEI